ncbi:MAG: hypothetical protein IJT79_08370 [Ruminococcus sp.]|nr:hypothetical protein [Ruminococcus sp.]
MTPNDFYEQIKKAGFPVAEAEYKKAVNPPYLVTLKGVDESVYANGKKVIPVIKVDIELYTEKNDNSSQARLEDWFDSNDVEYEMKERAWITEENLYVTVYKVSLYE